MASRELQAVLLGDLKVGEIILDLLLAQFSKPGAYGTFHTFVTE
jgi:hypothetical protein